MDRRAMNTRQALSSSPTDARAITDEPVESEESESRSPYGSASTMSSSFSSSTENSDHEEENPPTQQQQDQQHANNQQRRRIMPANNGISDAAASSTVSIPQTAVVRRKPLHQTLVEGNDDNFEVALSWHRNKRILLSRLMETYPKGKLSLVRVFSSL